MALRGNQNTGLRIPEYIVLLQNSLAAVKNTNSSVTTVKNLVPLQRGIGIGFYPDTSHGIVKYFVLFEKTEATIVDQDTAILASPDLVTTDDGIAAGADLDARVKMVEDVIILELAVAVVVEIDANLEIYIFTIDGVSCYRRTHTVHTQNTPKQPPSSNPPAFPNVSCYVSKPACSLS